MLLSPLGPGKGFTAVGDSCPLCRQCGAAITAQAALNTAAQWICIFCHAHNHSPDRYAFAGDEEATPDWTQFPEVHDALAVEWDEGPVDHLVADTTDTIVFVLDLTMARDDLDGVIAGLIEALRVLVLGGANPNVGLIGFDNTVQAFHLDSGLLSSALCFPAVRPLTASEQEKLQDPKARGRLIVPLDVALQDGAAGGLLTALNVMSQSALYDTNAGQATRERGLANALDVAAFLTNPLSFDPDAPTAYAERAKDAAPLKVNRGKIVYICGGPPNLYPRSLHNNPQLYWEELSAKLRFHYNIHSVDGLFVSAHQSLLESFLPHLMLHVSGGPLHIPLPPKDALPDFGRALSAAFAQLLKPLEYAAVSMSVYAEANVEVTHVIGPFIGRTNKLHHLQGSNRFGANDAVALYLDQKLASGSETHVQLVCTYVDLQAGKLVKRVLNVPLTHTRNEDEFADSVDDAVTGALLIKRVMSSVDNAKRINPEASGFDRFSSAIDRALVNSLRQFEPLFSQNLAALPFVCYCLRKSPMLLDSNDDQNFVMRRLALRFNVGDTQSLLFPKLFRVMRSEETGAPTVVGLPPEDLALNPRYILGMDSFTHLFLWSGALTADMDHVDELRAAAVDHLLMSSLDRCPAPLLYSVRDGDSASRFVTHQLVPSHLDTAAEMEQSFPELKQMSEEERKLFIMGLGFTDELSFNQYFRMQLAEAKRRRD